VHHDIFQILIFCWALDVIDDQDFGWAFDGIHAQAGQQTSGAKALSAYREYFGTAEAVPLTRQWCCYGAAKAAPLRGPARSRFPSGMTERKATAKA